MSVLHRIDAGSSGGKGSVVFVHGLGGDDAATWRSGDDAGTSWPAWLAAERPELAVWALDYAADFFDRSGRTLALPDRAIQVLRVLTADHLEQRPIVFICHSLGGLLVKQLLRTAQDASGTPEGLIFERTAGVVFLATPHGGADLASLLDRLGRLFGSSPAIEDLRANTAALLDLAGWYRKHAPAADITTLVLRETLATRGQMVVEAMSADPGIAGVVPIPVEADHTGIAKPASREAMSYRQVLRFIDEQLQRATEGAGQGTSPRSLVTAPQARKETSMAGNRSMSIGGSAYGNVINQGDNNPIDARMEIQISRGELPAASSVDIQAELKVLRELLAPLAGEKRRRVEAALTEAEELAEEPEPPKDQIGAALERAVGYVGSTEKLAQSGEKLWPVLKSIGGWLGEYGARVLKLAGIVLT